MKKTLFIFLVLGLIISSIALNGCGGTNSNPQQETAGSGMQQDSAGYKDINADELKSMKDSDKNLMIVDVREKEEWDQGHIDGSLLVPTSQFQARINELPKDRNIALVCATGARSAQVADYLIQMGYNNVYNLSGGLSSWSYDLVK